MKMKQSAQAEVLKRKLESMRRAIDVVGLMLLFLFLGCCTTLAQGQEAPPTLDSTSKDITATITELNRKYASALANEWRTGHVTPRELRDGLTLTESGYRLSLPSGAPLPTPTYYDGRIYVSGGFHSKEFYCVDAQSGKTVWGISLDDDGPSTAVVAEGVVLFNTESCTIFAVDAVTGEHKWSWWLGDPLMSTPTIHKGYVYTSYPSQGAVGASHVLACFELQTGRVVWQKWIDSDVMSAPVGSGDELMVTSFGGTIYRFEAETGALLSAIQTGATSVPIVRNGEFIYTQRSDDHLGYVREGLVRARGNDDEDRVLLNDKRAIYLEQSVQEQSTLKELGNALDAGNGFSNGAPQSANAAVAARNIGQGNVSTLQSFQGSRVLFLNGTNINTMGDEVIASDAETGEVKWRVPLDGDLADAGGALGTAPVAAGGELIVGTLDGRILRIRPDDGTLIHEYDVKSQIRTQPIVVNGRIYVGTVDGQLVSIMTGRPELTGWVTWGGDMAHTGLAE